jgi:hypothetical protein
LLATPLLPGLDWLHQVPNAGTVLIHMHILLPLQLGDWLQGPYVYALYEYYGFTVKDIGRLFIAGFGSSMIFGTVVGSLADKQ